MSYATKADLIARFGQDELIKCTDRTNRPPTTIDDDAVGRALDDADGEINGYLASGGIVTPMAAPPSVLVAKACAMARYLLHKDMATDKIRADYEDARSWLRDVAAGRVKLGDVSAPAKAPSLGPVKVSAPHRMFTSDAMKGL
jgi:phage gp36-like protein